MGSKSELRSVSENEDQSDEDRAMPIKNQTKKLEISDEDRTIGGVTFKVYWDYFRNGSYPCAIFRSTCLCLFTPGTLDHWSVSKGMSSSRL